MTPFGLSLRLPHHPRCPSCQCDIHADAWIVVDTVVFCFDCARLCEPTALIVQIEAAYHSPAACGFERRNGIWWYAPHEQAARDVSAAVKLLDGGFPNKEILIKALPFAGRRRSPSELLASTPYKPIPGIIERKLPTLKQADGDGLFDGNPEFNSSS